MLCVCHFICASSYVLNKTLQEKQETLTAVWEFGLLQKSSVAIKINFNWVLGSQIAQFIGNESAEWRHEADKAAAL